ncbi:uncharacterized protein LOC129586851 [Paramacrobiotus metropolitanus]|uniref:uncharacterized protein LOC129586851 n=1 Tax=Paramacrobiotus metropolitanus TaxID=2943436 RepID=UPI002445DC21|nr:uncharacterized protein LOC129586851 [Paramacrobiotus metropolitanus]
MFLPNPTPTFVLQHPKIYKSYLYESIPSLLANTDIKLDNKSELSGRRSSFITRNNVKSKSRHVESPSECQCAKIPRDGLGPRSQLFGCQIRKCFYGVPDTRQYNRLFLLLVEEPKYSVDGSEFSRSCLSTLYDADDIIVCIRDENKPLAENLVRAYAINAELLCSTMTYFRDILSAPNPCDERSSTQVSLFLPKILWDWLLSFAKFSLLRNQEKSPPVEPSLALPLFGAVIMMGMKSAEKVILAYILHNWRTSVQCRDRTMDRILEKSIPSLAVHIHPELVEDDNVEKRDDWLIDRLYGQWNAELLDQNQLEPVLQPYFPLGSAKDVFLCTHCSRWMNAGTSTWIQCTVAYTFRRRNGTTGYAHSRHPDADFQKRVEHVNQLYESKERALFWNLYGLLNVLQCGSCSKVPVREISTTLLRHLLSSHLQHVKRYPNSVSGGQ